jgi:hypothetical protein
MPSWSNTQVKKSIGTTLIYLMTGRPEISVMVHGSADPRGGLEENITLSVCAVLNPFSLQRQNLYRSRYMLSNESISIMILN